MNKIVKAERDSMIMELRSQWAAELKHQIRNRSPEAIAVVRRMNNVTGARSDHAKGR